MDEAALPPSYSLELLAECYAVSRLPGDADLPDWAGAGPLLVLAWRGEEFSLVCLERYVPPEVKAERGWRVLQVAGTLDFSQVGVLAALLQPLAAAGISVFTISTFDTDLILVKEALLERAIQALESAGHAVYPI
jgi:hypothetical protein